MKKPISNFSFHQNTTPQLTTWQKMLVWILGVPANGILFVGVIGGLGIITKWTAERFLTPADNPPQAYLTLLGDPPSTASSLFAIAISIIISALFWIGAALVTHKLITWCVEKLNIQGKRLLFEISLLWLGWLPLGFVLASKNGYQNASLIFVLTIIASASLLFFLVHLLEKTWQKSNR